MFLFSGCYDPEPIGSDVGDELGNGIESSSATDTDVPPSSSAGDPEGGESESSGGEAPEDGETGPRLQRSEPANGNQHAPLSPSFRLYFDRIVSPDDAVGKLWVSQNGGTPQPVSPMYCEPDADPMCIAGVLPEEFRDGETGRLPGGSAISIVVHADFADPEGNTNTTDQVASFRTFDYEPRFYDDSDVVDAWCGGITYDPGTQALFVVGSPGSSAFVRKIPLAGGLPGAATTVATPTGSIWVDGLEAIGGKLYVPAAPTANIYLYENLAAADLMATEDIVTTTDLAPPLENFMGTWSLTQVGGKRYYAREGGYSEAPGPLLRFDGANWALFHGGDGLWDSDESVVVAGNTVDGVDYLFAAAGRHLYRLDVASATVIDEIQREDLEWGADMEVDSKGRLWIGTWNALVVLDAKSPALPLLTERRDIDATKLALREDVGVVHAYFHRFNGPCVIGHVVVEESELQ